MAFTRGEFDLNTPANNSGSNYHGRLMYQSHPSRESLFGSAPPNLVEATQNVQTIDFDDLQEMHELIWELPGYAAEWQPDLIPFFATGGIPYLVPMMHVLCKKGQQNLTDGEHFHMYPGLAWDGVIDGMNGELLFTSSFSDLIKSRIGDGPVRILVIDTTNTGNAVNNVVAAFQKALIASDVTPDSVSLRIIGIVNTSHAESQQPRNDKSLVTGYTTNAHVIVPSGFRFADDLVDRQFCEPEAKEGKAFPFQLAYCLAGNVPTEDKADLIGVAAVQKELTTNPNAKAGRLRIEYGNGETQQGTGLSNLPSRLISLLSLPVDAYPWKKLRERSDRPNQTMEQKAVSDEISEVSDGGLRLFELMHLSRSVTIEGLMKIKRPLTDAEVYWLGKFKKPPREIARKVCDSLDKGCCTSTEAMKYFEKAFPEFADASVSWWVEQIRQLPKEALADHDAETEIQEPDQSDDSQDSELSDDDGIDLALDFVVAVEGVENARALLESQGEAGMPIDEIEDYLNETWPITADRALTFISPTNEQVTLLFILECGGWDEAVACLEDWIAENTSGEG